MNSERWEQVQAIFYKAADLPPAHKRAMVEKLCNGDPTLMAEVLNLIAEDEQPHLLLDNITPKDREQCDAASVDGLSSSVQREIGPYRIVSLLGEGGMGVVYLAERLDIGGQVAIKLLRDAWFSPMRRERFAAEQRTMAQLHHPGIAQIYDSGTLENGTPWFVMEYAEGVSLTEYRNQQNGSPIDCVRLFRRVCEAVQYAHEHAIIHRDLKPSNILVTPRGDVKLLDFGIAKQLQREDDGSRTKTGLRLMTPAYAAPEQTTGRPVGVYTDVYALGILLYELLTTHLPAEASVAKTQDPVPELAEIREAPSIVLHREQKDSWQQLGRTQWADLDALCLTAVRWDPQQRYRSVSALIRDIDAFLNGQPLEARAPTLSYRARKFCYRHRRALSTAAAVLLILSATITFFGIRLARAHQAALAEAARTRRIQEFTESLFQGGEAEAGPAEDVRVTDLLDRGRKEADALGVDPAMQAEMRATLGAIYEKLGKFEDAQPLLESAVVERREANPTDPAKLAESLRDLGTLRKDQGKLEEAQKLITESLEIERANLAGNDRETLRSDVALGAVLNKRGQYKDAEKVLQQALRLRPQDQLQASDASDNLSELANTYFYESRYDLAESLNRQALQIDLKLFGDRHPAVAKDYNNLGAIALDRGRYAESEHYYRQAVAITEDWYGMDHPETAANLTALSQPLMFQKKFDEAQSALERALLIQEHTHGHNHSLVATALNELGALAYDRSQDQLAEQDFREALDIYVKVYGDHHQFVAIAYANLGDVYAEEKDYPRAESNYRAALQRFHGSVSENDLNTAIAHLKLGRVLVKEGRLDEAEPETLTAYKYLVANVDSTSNFLTASRKTLADIYTRKNEPEKAARYRAELNTKSPAS